ncbi:MAG: cytochrome C biogenesis protein [Flavobacteriaceae bacterium]|nr:cytochrome C biogenesis protein [Flavobacteriaceae bacterium]|tara:strand:+ start:100011 stop:103187 length:3177 start_codon:yes stop_codon:yes gene_type:complete
MNTLKKILFSNRLTGILFISFAVAMAIGTFMDAGQDTSPTPLTRNLIYNAWWFEGIMLLFVINFIGNIFKYNLFNKRKWPVLLLHLSWIFILVGAFVTRYISYEGVMSIREGATENSFLSEKTYLTFYIDGDYEVNGQLMRRVEEDAVDFSPRLDNKFELNTTYNKTPISIKLTAFINGAEEDVVFDENGEYYLKIVESAGGMPHNHFLKEGSTENIHGTLYTLNNYIEGAVNITFDDNEDLYINSPYEGEYMVMANMSQGTLNKDTNEPLKLRARYIINNQQLVFPKPAIKGVFDIVKKSELLKSDQDGLELLITTPEESKTVRIIGGKGTNNAYKKIEIANNQISIKYGSKVYDLPFSVKLNDFIAEKYPGTDKSYSSFASEVSVIDEENFDYKIYMNNILNYKGYRFFQASFDPDEKGTILSVNYDSLGTFLTYLGYILLYIGMIVILFASFTRFDFLKKQLDVARKNKVKILTSLLILFSISTNSQSFGVHNHSSKPEIEIIDSILSKNIASKKQADKFGRLVIQDLGGRMMPMNTYSSELIRKLSKKDHYNEFDANQVFLSMQESPLLWYSVPLIFLKSKKGDSIRSIIGVSKESKHVSLADFFTSRGDYKLAPYLEEAYRAKVPNAFQKEFKETDQRVNLLYNSLEGTTIKIFPIPNDENNKWIAPSKTKFNEVTLIDSLYSNFINTGFKTYLYFLNEGKISGDFKDADDILSAITNTQIKYGSDVMLSKNKINAEILYNKYDIFKSLFSWYLYASSILFIALIIQIFNRNKYVNSIVSISKYATYLLFIIHALGLIARWYISGHAPWSDGYESMIYVAWATMLFGIYFGRKSELALASTTFVTSMILMIAHWSWMDPAIANLVPVLDSYWLMIHVAVIVGSYGPFTISMILGIVSLILMILLNERNKEILGINIRELVLINEMSMTIGLVMLTIGNFLGGMWANESWGRYWGWDPKETWALISIMIYAFVLHMRLIPGLKSNFIFTVASILSFGSIIMTYFGVNFYLAGLHSYAKDDQEISFVFIGISLSLIFILSLIAFPKYRKYIKNNR